MNLRSPGMEPPPRWASPSRRRRDERVHRPEVLGPGMPVDRSLSPVPILSNVITRAKRASRSSHMAAVAQYSGSSVRLRFETNLIWADVSGGHPRERLLNPGRSQVMIPQGFNDLKLGTEHLGQVGG